jgi:hypothetical protein
MSVQEILDYISDRPYEDNIQEVLDSGNTIVSKKDLVMAALLSSGKFNLINLSPELQQDKNAIMNIIKNRDDGLGGKIIEEISNPTILQNQEIILEAVKSNPHAISYMPIKDKQDKEFVLQCIAANPDVYMYIDVKLQNDADVTRAALAKDTNLVSSVGPELQAVYANKTHEQILDLIEHPQNVGGRRRRSRHGSRRGRRRSKRRSNRRR